MILLILPLLPHLTLPLQPLTVKLKLCPAHLLPKPEYYLANPYTGTRDEVSEHAPPYASIKWISGISVKNMIPSNPSLQINEKTGQLSVKANSLGLFVFGIVCEKYRNGVKIGSSYHEFQLPVVDCYYQTPPAPVISYQNNPAKEMGTIKHLGVKLHDSDIIY